MVEKFTLRRQVITKWWREKVEFRSPGLTVDKVGDKTAIFWSDFSTSFNFFFSLARARSSAWSPLRRRRRWCGSGRWRCTNESESDPALNSKSVARSETKVQIFKRNIFWYWNLIQLNTFIYLLNLFDFFLFSSKIFANICQFVATYFYEFRALTQQKCMFLYDEKVWFS
jgi:hypothetical protein